MTDAIVVWRNKFWVLIYKCCGGLKLAKNWIFFWTIKTETEQSPPLNGMVIQIDEADHNPQRDPFTDLFIWCELVAVGSILSSFSFILSLTIIFSFGFIWQHWVTLYWVHLTLAPLKVGSVLSPFNVLLRVVMGFDERPSKKEPL